MQNQVSIPNTVQAIAATAAGKAHRLRLMVGHPAAPAVSIDAARRLIGHMIVELHTLDAELADLSHPLPPADAARSSRRPARAAPPRP